MFTRLVHPSGGRFANQPSERRPRRIRETRRGRRKEQQTFRVKFFALHKGQPSGLQATEFFKCPLELAGGRRFIAGELVG